MEEPLSARPDFLVLSNKVDEKKLKNPVQVQDDQQSPFLVDQNQNQNFQIMKLNMNLPILSQNLLQFQNSNNSLFSNHNNSNNNNSFMNKQGSAVKGLDSVFSFNYDNMLPSSHLSVQKSEQNQNLHFQENQTQNQENNNDNNKMNMRNSTSPFQKFQIQNSRKSSLNFDIFGENSNLEERQISLKQFEDENIEKYFQEEQDKDELNFGDNIFLEQQQQSFNKDHPQQFQLFDQETDFGFKIQSQSKFANQPQLFYQQDKIQNKKQQQQTELQQESDFEMEFPPLDISNDMQEQEDTQTQTNINFAYQNADNNDKNNEIQNSIFSSNNDNSSTTLTTFNNKDFKQQNTTNFSDDNDNLFKTSYNNNNQKNNELNNIWKISEKKITKNKKKQRDYDKNICRYLARQVIRCFVDKIYKSEVVKFCAQEINLNKQKQQNQQNNQQKNLSIDELYNSCRLFLLGKIEFVTGHRAFQELLICEEQQEKFLEKCVFKRFTYWFLKNRALRYIISGAMSDKQSYLQFKNQVMLHYVKRPETWNANLVKKTNKKRKPRIVKIELD